MSDTKAVYSTGKYILASGVVIFAIGQSLLFIIVAPVARSIGVAEWQFGAILSLANLSLLFAGPFWGKKSDLIGRKPIFVVGLMGSAIGTLAMAGTLTVGMSGSITAVGLLGLIFVSRALYGLTASAIYPSAAAYIADVTDFDNRAKGMALIGGANALGSILGPAIGGGLAFMGILFPMYAAAAISLFGGIAAMVYLTEPEQHQQRKQNKDAPKPNLKFTDPRLVPYMIMWATVFVIFIGLNVSTPFYIEDRFKLESIAAVTRTASLMLAAMAIVITLVQGVLFQIIKISPQLLLRICSPIFAVALFTMAFAPSLPILALAFGLFGAGFACATPGINGSASLKMAPHEQGVAAGYLAAANTTGAILGPIVGTTLYFMQPNAPMLFGGVLMAILSVYALTIAPPEPQPDQSA
jgi:MFS family permease